MVCGEVARRLEAVVVRIGKCGGDVRVKRPEWSCIVARVKLCREVSGVGAVLAWVSDELASRRMSLLHLRRWTTAKRYRGHRWMLVLALRRRGKI